MPDANAAGGYEVCVVPYWNVIGVFGARPLQSFSLAYLNEQEAAMTLRFALVTALLGTLALGAVTGGADVNAAQAAQQTPSAQGPVNMKDMMKMHEQMMAEMKAGNAKLDALVREMNAASGNDKINAVAAVVNELVQQHKAMHEHMGQMHQQMMGGRGMMMRR